MKSTRTKKILKLLKIASPSSLKDGKNHIYLTADEIKKIKDLASNTYNSTIKDIKIES